MSALDLAGQTMCDEAVHVIMQGLRNADYVAVAVIDDGGQWQILTDSDYWDNPALFERRVAAEMRRREATRVALVVPLRFQGYLFGVLLDLTEGFQAMRFIPGESSSVEFYDGKLSLGDSPGRALTLELMNEFALAISEE